MATFTRFNRKAALLLAKLSEIGYSNGTQTVSFLGLTVNAIRNWREAVKVSKHSQKVSDGLRTHFNIPGTADLLSNAVSVKEFSSFLGYTTDEGRKIIDEAYTELYPAYSTFYSDEDTADDILKLFGRFNFIYRIENNSRVKAYTDRDDNILQMPLSVRYMIKGTKPQSEKLFRVRCKLNIPSYTTATPFFEYDGYITPQGHGTHYWLFENRSEQNKDLIFMITGYPWKAHQSELGYAQGIMITRRQDAQRIHKVWKILMLQIEQSDIMFFDANASTDPESKFMTQHCKILSKNDVPSWVIEKIEEPLNGFDTSSFMK